MRAVWIVLLLLCVAAPRAALAIPVLANGQGGVNCGLCHTAVPKLNAYGRYVLLSNFSRGLNKTLQMQQEQSTPLALEVTANAASRRDPALPAISNALTQFMSAGFVGRHVSYFATIPVVSGGFPAQSVDQVWAAYDGIAGGKGSLQAGKFATPIFAPWISQPLSLTGYGAAAIQAGPNYPTLADNRWGLSYTQLAASGVIGNVSLLTSEGTAWTASLQYLSPESHWSGGIAAMLGTYPLPSGQTDRYTRAAAIASYSIDRYEVLALDVAGHDGTPAAASNGLALETIFSPLFWLHLDARYERNTGGAGGASTDYIGDLALNLRPNIVLTAEDVASPAGKPLFNYQLLWAGPWLRHRFPKGSVPRAPIGESREIANGRSIFFTGRDLHGVRITADPARVYQSCAVCHGPQGQGGVQLPDGAISAKLGPHAHMLDDMGPAGGGMGGMQMSGMDMSGMDMSGMDMSGMKTSDAWTLAQMERAISHGVDNEGEQLSPVMPRWKMSKRDLHDIAQYVLTQIR